MLGSPEGSLTASNRNHMQQVPHIQRVGGEIGTPTQKDLPRCSCPRTTICEVAAAMSSFSRASIDQRK